MTLKELRDKRIKLLADVDAIKKISDDEKRSLTGEEMTKARAMLDEAEQLRSKIDELEEQEKLDTRMKAASDELRSSRGRRTDPGQPGGEGGQGRARTPEQDQSEHARAFRQWLRDPELLTGDMRSLLRNARARVEDGAVAFDEEGRSLNVGTAGSGGYYVAPLFQQNLSTAMLDFQGIRQAGAEVIPTDSGADLPFPTGDDTANEAVIIAEEASHATGTDPTIGSKTVKTYMYSTKTIKVSLQLLQDSAFPIESWLMSQLAIRLGRGTNTHFTTGNGTTQPEGIVTAMTGSNIGVTAALTTAFTADEVIRLQHSVDRAYRDKGSYAMSDAVYLVARLLKDSGGRPIFTEFGPGLSGNGPVSVGGRPVNIFNKMATSVATAATVMLYGDFSHYKIREVRNSVQMFRMNELFIENGQVGFLALGRYGGGYVDPGTRPVKSLKMA